VAIAPLCRCSEGGGEGGTRLTHRDGCQWKGREEEYRTSMIAACMQLQRVKDEEDMLQLRFGKLQIREGKGEHRYTSVAAAADSETHNVP
jgi:hypothetical protein